MMTDTQVVEDRRQAAPKRRQPAGRPPRAERRCLATGQVGDPAGMIRFVADPQGLLTPDLAAKLPGRGAWVTARRDCLERALRRKLFGRALGRDVAIPDALIERLEQGLRRRLLDLIGLSAKAGQAVSGFEKVRAALGAGRVAVLLQAADAAADGRGKLARLGRAVDPSLPVLAPASAAELGRALGREAAVHLALLPGRLAEQVLAEAKRLDGLAADGAASGADGDESVSRPGSPGSR